MRIALAALAICALCAPAALGASVKGEVKRWGSLWALVDRDLARDVSARYARTERLMRSCPTSTPRRERRYLARWVATNRAIAARGKLIGMRARTMSRLRLPAGAIDRLRDAQVDEIRAWVSDARAMRPVVLCDLLRSVESGAQEMPGYPLRNDNLQPVLTRSFLRQLGLTPAEVGWWADVTGVSPARTRATERVRAIPFRAVRDELQRRKVPRSSSRAVLRALHDFRIDITASPRRPRR